MATPVIREEIVYGYVKWVTNKHVPWDIVKLIQLMIHCVMSPNIMDYTLDLRHNLMVKLSQNDKEWTLKYFPLVTCESIEWMENVFLPKLQNDSNNANNIPSFLRIQWDRAADRARLPYVWNERLSQLFSDGAISFLLHAMASHIKYGELYPIWQSLYLEGKRTAKIKFCKDVISFFIEYTQIDIDLEQYYGYTYDEDIDFKDIYNTFNLLYPCLKCVIAAEGYFRKYCWKNDMENCLNTMNKMSNDHLNIIWWVATTKNTNGNRREFVIHLLNGVVWYAMHANPSGYDMVEAPAPIFDDWLDRYMEERSEKNITFDHFVERFSSVLLDCLNFVWSENQY